MNPSSSGWINKFEHLVNDKAFHYHSFDVLYTALSKTGFVYGLNINTPPFFDIALELTEDEKAKINLVYALYATFILQHKQSDFNDFIECVYDFYKTLNIINLSIVNKIFTEKKTSSKIEKLIDTRVYIEDNLISKTFNSNITNALLFIDVLVFKKYLSDTKAIKEHAQFLEKTTINLAYHALNSKETNAKDKRLAQLFAASLTFIEETKNTNNNIFNKDLSNQFSTEARRYFLDILCITIWEDQSLDFKESEFIYKLGESLNFKKNTIKKHLEKAIAFFEINESFIPHLKDHNLAFQFYDNMGKVVKKLILRNSNRLKKELKESKELVALLSKSTTKELSTEEKKKIQNQLLDIFKSIPSLAIFILPGGAILLPIFIKLIPKLLPSSFDENRVE